MAVHNKRIRVGLLLLGVVVLVGAGVLGAFMRPPLEPDQVVKTRFGDVEWNHEQHARMKEIASCQVCHHKERAGTVKPKPCHHCHKPQSNQASVVVADLHTEVEKVKKTVTAQAKFTLIDARTAEAWESHEGHVTSTEETKPSPFFGSGEGESIVS